MALDNLRCPQFVDFTNRATFDIHDGADVYFERGVVGELGLGFDDDINNPNDDGIDELIAALNSHTTLNTHQSNKNDNKKDSGISEAFSMSTTNNQAQMTSNIESDKTHNDTTTTSKKSDNNKKQQQKEPLRKRTTSACSNTSVGSTSNNNKTSSKLQNNSQINSSSNSNNKNIVKKTIAKVTAAFKTNKLTTVTNDSQLKLKTKSTSSSANNNQKKKQEPLKVEYKKQEDNNNNNEKLNDENHILDHETTSSSTNRRCSSVPRTLKERQAVGKQITLGEKIQNFFSRDTNKTHKTTEERSKLKNIADNEENHENKPVEKKQQTQQHQHRSRVQTDEETKIKPHNTSRAAANTSKNANNSQLQRQPTLTEPKSPNFSKPRQRSCDRKDMPLLPYQGVKFIPKLSHKYTAVEPFSNLEERAKQLGVKREAKKLLQEIEPNKPMIALNDNNKKPLMATTTQQTVTRLNSSLNTAKLGSSNKENSIVETTATEVKQMNSTTTCSSSTSVGNDSVLSNKAGNLSTLSNSSRKRVDLSNKPMNLHTEQRAQKRHQYDQYLKDKERMAELIKKNLEMQKMIESKNEIQKLRQTQCLFKSKPFKYTKPMEIKPSEKPLTEPKSPVLHATTATTSSSKLNSTNGSIKGPMRSLSQDNIRLA